MHDDDRGDDPLARGQAEPGAEDGTGAGESAEEAAWREIVANFGERAVLDDGMDEPLDEGPGSDAFVIHFADHDRADEDDAEPIYLEDEERYVPPPPPPLPHTTPARLMAWLGVLGTPVVAVLLVTIHALAHIEFPSWLIAFLVLAFLGGFGYLLVTMSRDPGDPWDDGARV